MKFKQDKRSAWEQVKSGTRIASALVISLLTVAVFARGYEQLRKAENSWQTIVGWVLLVLIAGLLAATIRFWRLWFYGVPGYLGFRSLRLFLGPIFGLHYPGVSLLWAISFPAVMFLMASLSFRFGKKTRRMSKLESAALFIASLCLLLAISNLFSLGAVELVLIFGVCADAVLLVPWINSRTATIVEKYSRLAQKRGEV